MKNQIQMIGAILITLIIFSFKTEAQKSSVFVKTNIFHRIPSPMKLIEKGKLSLTAGTVSAYPDITTFRIIGPVAGYGVINNDLIVGVGYGFNRLHYIDSLSTYNSKYSLNAMLWGTAALGVPSLNPNNKNVIGIGPSVGLFNNILILGYCWKAPFIAGTTGQSDFVIAGHLPIN